MATGNEYLATRRHLCRRARAAKRSAHDRIDLRPEEPLGPAPGWTMFSAYALGANAAPRHAHHLYPTGTELPVLSGDNPSWTIINTRSAPRPGA